MYTEYIFDKKNENTYITSRFSQKLSFMYNFVENWKVSKTEYAKKLYITIIFGIYLKGKKILLFKDTPTTNHLNFLLQPTHFNH